MLVASWCNGKRPDWWPKGDDLGQVVYTHVPLFIKQYNLVPVVKGWWRSAAGKVTVGLASHWPCITDSVVYPPTGSTATEREMSTLPTPLWGIMAPLPFYLTAMHHRLPIRSSAFCCKWPVDLEFAVWQSSWLRTKSLRFQMSADKIFFCEILK